MFQISSYIEIGKRENIEDAFYVSSCGTLIIVCDGVGGNHRGEDASRIVCEVLSNELQNLEFENAENKLISALQVLQKEMISFVSLNPEAEKMATTLVLVKIFQNEQKVFVAHIGDSRAYLFENNYLKFQTQDHSLVNELLKSGFITQEEAVNHPKRNVITRSLNSDNPSDAEMQWWDLRQNNTLMLCTDGVLESWSDNALQELFKNETSSAFLIDKIRQKCIVDSRDNHTAVVVRLNLSDQSQTTTPPIRKKPSKQYHNFLLSLVILFVLVCIGYSLFYKKNKKSSDSIKMVSKESIVSDTIVKTASFIQFDTTKNEVFQKSKDSIRTIDKQTINIQNKAKENKLEIKRNDTSK